jgi:phenylalanyl-tRNA synthetase beta chain
VLEGLGFELEDAGSECWRVTAPSWRYYDFENVYPADVYEEVLRIHGLDDVPATLPQIGGTDAPERLEHTNARRIRDTLAASGFAEAIHFGFYDRTADETYPSLYGERPALPLANPLSDRYALMRRSLLPNLVESAYYNQRRGATSVRLFEVGHIFAAEGAEAHVEQEVVALVLGGSVGSPWEREVELDFFDLKGALEEIFAVLGVEMEVRPAAAKALVKGATAELYRPGHEQPVGYLGELIQDEVPFPLFVAEVATEGLLVAGEIDLKTQTPSRFPGIALDSTLTHSLEIPWGEIRQAIEALAVEDLVQVTLKDRYRGKGVPKGAVNTTIAFLYNAEGRSLTQEEVNERHQRVVGELDGRFARHAGS